MTRALLVLDHPIWAALSTVHEPLSVSYGLARRYRSGVSPLAALREPSPEAFRDLSQIVAPEETVALFTTTEVEVPGDWEVVRERWIDQMVFEGPIPDPGSCEALGETDLTEMLALAEATEPGPFLPRTIEMGRYFGIRSEDGRLASMAGERLRLDGFTEVSAVCTHPEFRGRGYAGAIISALISHLHGESSVPFLHVKTENGAKQLYEKLGFRVRRPIRLTVVSKKP